MEKEIAIEILKDIRNALNSDDWKKSGLKTISIYRKNLELSLDVKIQKLIKKQNEYIKKYGENGRKTIKVNKKIDKEIQKIFSK